MVARSARRRSARARYAGRQAASSQFMSGFARAGLAARGAMYGLIGIIAAQIALAGSRQQADRSGALRLVAASPVGELMLWLLAIGFAGLTLWRLSEAAFGAAGPRGYKTSTRLMSLARAVIYGSLTYTILKYALGLGAPSSTDRQSQDLTATALKYPGGQALVVVVGAVVASAGFYVAYEAYRRKFLQHMRMRSASPGTRKAVTWLGEVGGIARGLVFAIIGVFLVVAAVQARPAQAKGIDSALRTLAQTPFGPWLLALVAFGLVLFGVFSCCEARWRQV